MGGIFVALISLLIKDAQDLTNFSLSCVLIGTIANFIIYFETPYFLLRKGKLSQLLDTLYKISIQNQAQNSKKEIQKSLGLEELDMENFYYKMEVKGNYFKSVLNQIRVFLEIFSREYLWMTLAFMSEFIVEFTLFYSLITALTHLGIENIQANQILSCITIIAGSFLAVPVLNKFGRKNSSQLLLAMFIVIGAILGILSYFFSNKQFSKILQTFLCTAGFGSVLGVHSCIVYTHAPESYPTKIRGLAFGLILFVGRLATGASPYLIVIGENLGLNPMVLPCSLTLISLPLSIFLKETISKKK